MKYTHTKYNRASELITQYWVRQDCAEITDYFQYTDIGQNKLSVSMSSLMHKVGKSMRDRQHILLATSASQTMTSYYINDIYLERAIQAVSHNSESLIFQTVLFSRLRGF